MSTRRHPQIPGREELEDLLDGRTSPGHGEAFTRKMEQAIGALLTCPTVKDAAAQVGVNEKTLRTWMNVPKFEMAYSDARRKALDGSMDRVRGLMDEAVQTLKRSMTCGVPSVEVKAALGILETASRKK